MSTYYLEDLLEHTNHIIEEGSRYARRDVSGRETVSMFVTSRGGEKRKETADYQMNDDASDDFPGYKLATRKYVNSVFWTLSCLDAPDSNCAFLPFTGRWIALMRLC